MYAWDTVGSVSYWFTDNAEGDLMHQENRDRLTEKLGLKALVTMEQMHGTEVWWADPSETPPGDAQLTDQPGIGLLVATADCVPIAIAGGGVVGVIHAGRRGLVAGVVAAAVAEIRTRTDSDLTAWVGPHICGNCYGLDAASAHDVAEAVPEARCVSREGTPAANLGRGVLAQLRALDVAAVSLGGCTYEDDRFFCHRQNADSRRQGVVVALQ